MTALQAAHFRLWSQALERGSVRTHVRDFGAYAPMNLRTRPCVVNGTIYDSVRDALAGEHIGERHLARLVAEGKVRYLD